MIVQRVKKQESHNGATRANRDVHRRSSRTISDSSRPLQKSVQ